MHTFQALPFDVFFEICTTLDLEDIVHLSLACRHLRALLLNHTVAHRAVETLHPYTEEARQARKGEMTYGQALCAIYDRRRAFSDAHPFSARVVGRGSAFLYRQGVLCVQDDNTVIVSNLRSGTPAVHINLPRIFAATDPGPLHNAYELMYYSDGILAIHVTNEAWPEDESLLQFLKTADNLHDSERLIKWVPLEVDTSRLFVRHTAEYFCFGTHTGNGGDNHRKWVVKCFDYKNNTCEEGDQKLLLEDFHGNDIGSTVAFEVHDGYFYAVSNQGTYEVEEVDWTSFYHCVRFPLDNPVKDALQKNKTVYRRQHAEGAIHDSWTDLALQHDERTNNLLIVESRREWIRASSRQARTFYTSHIAFDTGASLDSPSPSATGHPFPLPDNDILTTALDSSNAPNYMPTPAQYSWTQHPENAPVHSANQPPIPRSFILARTKFRAYNASCATFIDLVEDDACCPRRAPTEQPCLRLRIGSRRAAPAASPSSYTPSPTASPAPLPRSIPQVPFKDSTTYRHTPTRLFPPRPTCACTRRLHAVMNRARSGGQRNVAAVCDERSVVFMGVAMGGRGGEIVLVDFGRGVGEVQGAAQGEVQGEGWTAARRGACAAGTC
ncbi:hypothetical protein C7974DRAFT_201375 [Boeremia exigua]|uniref:uncharacterized protein n=1 Tax=Boeremia exigua TaxID=749465 RepID=UPI001E8E3313|nr:uncharacterized protein C7974DRAFT_201375 [Boeremia exigua]KAH6625439.1 hypothetical protein C7974DRAFT_201375 [Boeremia exigua]